MSVSAVTRLGVEAIAVELAWRARGGWLSLTALERRDFLDQAELVVALVEEAAGAEYERGRRDGLDEARRDTLDEQQELTA